MDRIKNHILRLLTRARLVSAKYPRKQQNPDCLLLKLPLELLELVIEQLPISGQMCLLQTCSSVYNSFELPRDRVTFRAKREHPKYLALVARDPPDMWISIKTPRIRFVKRGDLPKLPKSPPYLGAPGWDSKALCGFPTGALMVEHKHVQMSIKYSQLEKKTRWQSKYLQVLLKPYKTKFNPMLDCPPSKWDASIGYFESYPKVISGRYLLYTERSFTTNFTSIPALLQLLGPFGPCLHQYTDPKRYDEYQRQKALDDEMMALTGEAPSYYNSYCMSSLQPQCSEQFFSSIQQATAEKNTWVNGYCYWCRTEYSICVTNACITLRAWRDLGGCNAPHNYTWQEHLSPLVFGPGEMRDPLSIRTLYGELAITKRL
jgi:hypothetical protein